MCRKPQAAPKSQFFGAVVKILPGPHGSCSSRSGQRVQTGSVNPKPTAKSTGTTNSCRTDSITVRKTKPLPTAFTLC